MHASEQQTDAAPWQRQWGSWISTPRNIPDTPSKYCGPPSPGCAPAAEEKADAIGWDTFKEAAAKEVKNGKNDPADVDLSSL